VGRAALCGVALALGVALLSASGCAETVPDFHLAGARSALLTVTVRESVSFRGFRPQKEVRFGLRGSPVADGARVVVETEILWLELTYEDQDGAVVAMATDSKPQDAPFGPLDIARRAVLEAMIAEPVALGFVGNGGIDALEGLDAALVTAAERAIDEGVNSTLVGDAVAGLSQMLDDRRVLRGLIAAGVAAAPPEVARGKGEVRRYVDIFVAGRGVTRLTTIGSAGRTASGESSVRCEGRVAAGALFSGDAGPEPPAQIGPVDLDDVRVVVSTEYAGANLQPLRGHVGVESPHLNGPLVNRSLDFILLVDG